MRLSISTSPRLHSVSVFVSANAEQYRKVDISGAPNGASIRERLYAKLSISEENKYTFSIYESEIGSFATGEALSDYKLFEICRDYGDPTGNLKFFISPYPDRPTPRSWAAFSPTFYMSSRSAF